LSADPALTATASLNLLHDGVPQPRSLSLVSIAISQSSSTVRAVWLIKPEMPDWDAVFHELNIIS
jgi:hypothetical protein